MKKIYLLLISAIISVGAYAQAVQIASNPNLSQNAVVGTLNYHVLEAIYLNQEIGNNNFTNAGSAIQEIFFLLNTEGLNTSIANYRVYMKNVAAATTTLATGVYSTAGYTMVFNGTYTATPAGYTPIILTTPFVHTAGSNIQLLIERLDNVIHLDNTTGGYIYQTANGNINNAAALTSRRYNSATLPVSGTSSLTASVYRPAIVFNHTFAIDAVANDILLPRTTCFNSPQTVLVEIFNAGTLNIAAGAASATLHIRGANNFSGTATNSAIILPGAAELVAFNGVNLNAQGNHFDTAYVTLASDGTTYNDTVSTVNAAAPIISTFPIVENVEEFYPIVPTSDLDVFRYTETIVFDDLWTLMHGDYFNTDQTVHLVPIGWPVDSSYYLFDSYSGSNSDGFESRLYSNCIDLTTATAALLTFSMSHDNVFPGILDSMYVSVSSDRGVTWNRLPGGYGRFDATGATPFWRQESINLAAYLGQTIQVGFEGVSKYGNAIGLDNITITATLPVTVLSFTAQRNGKVNDLNWRTAQEVNSSKFIIERSTDGGANFVQIGQVAAAGNSGVERNYRFTDMTPVKGINYYRLRIVDLDNRFKLSEVKNVRNFGTVDLAFANPVQQSMEIKLNVEKADKGSISITDMSGKLVYSSAVNVSEGNNDISIETGKFAPGLYIIQVQLSDSRIIKKFSKL